MTPNKTQAPTATMVRERFNEKLDYGVAPSIKSKKDEALSAYSKGPASTYKGGDGERA